jgi:hypothetical protein
VGIIDPPRPEAIAALKTCREAGIRVKMITGDHAGTATAIGREMGFTDHDHGITGTELEAASDEKLRELVRDHDIFARTSPFISSRAATCAPAASLCAASSTTALSGWRSRCSPCSSSCLFTRRL